MCMKVTFSTYLKINNLLHHFASDIKKLSILKVEHCPLRYKDEQGQVQIFG